MRNSILAACTAAAVVLGSTAAAAQAHTCDKRQRIIDQLVAKYKEAPIAIGVTNAGGLVEVFSTGDGQTWTIIVSAPNGISCLLAAGEGWRPLRGSPGGAKEPQV